MENHEKAINALQKRWPGVEVHAEWPYAVCNPAENGIEKVELGFIDAFGCWIAVATSKESGAVPGNGVDPDNALDFCLEKYNFIRKMIPFCSDWDNED